MFWGVRAIRDNTLMDEAGVSRADEVRCVQEAAAGSAQSFAVLVDRYERAVYAYVLSRTRNRDVAQEVVQETFVRAFDGLTRFDSTQRFLNWVMGIAHHVTQEWLRDQEYQRRAVQQAAEQKRAEQHSARVEEPDDSPVNAIQSRILKAIDECPDRYRMPLMMRYLEQLDYAEIASTLGLSGGQVKGLLYRGTQMLRERLSDLKV
jgi:RNA polymerase sigma-70 factor, ECF subfamily